MPGVFISYRRGDGGWAGRLKDHLLLRFGDRLVWQDVDDLKLGTRFPQEIAKAIRTADAVLVVIGPYWSTKGLERLRNAKDMVRMEIRQALGSRATIIPVLVGGAGMPTAKDLPAPVAKLVELDAAMMSDMDWTRGVQLLIERLQEIVGAARRAMPVAELHDRLGALEARYFQMGNDPEQALRVAQDALHLLDEQMCHYPQDTFLQIERGYFIKNEAMARRDLGDREGFESALQRAEQVFTTMCDESKIHLAGAYNGLGSVQLLRANYREALGWIDRALELEPTYPAALNDRQVALAQLKAKRRRR